MNSGLSQELITVAIIRRDGESVPKLFMLAACSEAFSVAILTYELGSAAQNNIYVNTD
jgi:hypothetical protein